MPGGARSERHGREESWSTAVGHATAGAATLTCLLVTTYAMWGAHPPAVRYPAIALGAAGLVHWPLARRTWYWLTVAAVLLSRHLYQGYAFDDGAGLMVCWCLALSISPWARGAMPAARRAGAAMRVKRALGS